MDQVKTRIAPTPSGFLHFGNAYSFVVTALVAKREGASILLRIDDLDRQRYRQEYVEDIFRVLDFLGIEYHEGPQSVEDFEQNFSQIHRLPLYEEALSQLREEKLVFACDCTRSMLAGHSSYPGRCRTRGLENQKSAWRLFTENEPVPIQLLTGKNLISTLPDQMKDFVVRRKDKIPAYQLASIIDDIHFGVNLVVRGEDLYDSTIAQLYLARQLQLQEFLNTRFYHHSLILDEEGQKISKSHFAGSLSEMIRQGMSRSEFYSRISPLLGFKETVKNLEQCTEMMAASDWKDIESP